MLNKIMKNNKILELYLKDNKVLNLLLGISVCIILFKGLTFNMPVVLNLDYNIVNYFIDVMVNLAIGYITSLLFYIIVVFIPQTKRDIHLKSKYHPILIGIGLRIYDFLNTTFISIDFKYDESKNFN